MKTTEPTDTIRLADGAITYSATADAVCVTLRGKALDGLRRLAAAMNGCPWCDRDNTPVTLLEILTGDQLADLAQPTAKDGNIVIGGLGQLADELAQAVDTGFDCGTDEDQARREELRAAFAAAGIV